MPIFKRMEIREILLALGWRQNEISFFRRFGVEISQRVGEGVGKKGKDRFR